MNGEIVKSTDGQRWKIGCDFVRREREREKILAFIRLNSRGGNNENEKVYERRKGRE